MNAYRIACGLHLGATLVVAGCSGGPAADIDAPKPALTPDAGSPPATAAPAPPRCEASAATDISVASDDANGYPPYAIADCTLVYVDGTGALMLRDLSTKAETSLAPATEAPRRPAVAIDLTEGLRKPIIAWESSAGLRVRYGDAVTTITGDFVRASEPRVRDRFVTFTGWKGASDADDCDVWLYDARTQAATMVVGGAGQQRFADVSGTHVVATDFSEDPDGKFDRVNDAADLVVYDIASKTATRRAQPGKQAFPMLGTGDALAYLDWNEVHPQPKLQAFNLKAGTLTNPAADRLVAFVEYTAAEPARPALAGNTIEWIANPNGTTSLFRAPIDTQALPARVEGLDSLYLYPPAPRAAADDPGFTVIGTIDYRETERVTRLRAVAR